MEEKMDRNSQESIRIFTNYLKNIFTHKCNNKIWCIDFRKLKKK